VSVFFRVDEFERAEADELPSESEFAARIDTQKVNTSKLPRLEASEKELSAFKSKPSSSSAPSLGEGLPATMNYPPLESSAR
jgi:outer membrane protein assembly factor BamE